MAYVIQKLGMNHILSLKREALEMWDQYDKCPSMWYDCMDAVFIRHRIDMKEQYDKGNFREKNKDRRSQQQRLEDEVSAYEQEETIQKIRDAETVFDDCSTE